MPIIFSDVIRAEPHPNLNAASCTLGFPVAERQGYMLNDSSGPTATVVVAPSG